MLTTQAFEEGGPSLPTLLIWGALLLIALASIYLGPNGPDGPRPA